MPVPLSVALGLVFCLSRCVTLGPPYNPVPSWPCRCSKAYRLGKFLQDVVALQRVLASLQRSRSDRGAWLRTTLELISYIGEGTYLFLDQFLWCALQRRAFAAWWL